MSLTTEGKIAAIALTAGVVVGADAFQVRSDRGVTLAATVKVGVRF